MDQIKTGKFISTLRKEKELTQEELGRKIGVSNKTVSRWENGNYMPDIETLRILAKEFSVSIEEIIDGERSSSKEQKKTSDSFTVKEKINFWQRNWKRENRSWFVFWGIIVFIIAVFGFLFWEILLILDGLFAFGLYIWFYNKMCIYVDNNVYRQYDN